MPCPFTIIIKLEIKKSIIKSTTPWTVLKMFLDFFKPLISNIFKKNDIYQIPKIIFCKLNKLYFWYQSYKPNIYWHIPKKRNAEFIKVGPYLHQPVAWQPNIKKPI